MDLGVRDGRRCVNCGLEMAWAAVVVDGQPYCCGGCAQGGPCYCSYDPPQANGTRAILEPSAATGPLEHPAPDRGRGRR